MVQKKPQRSAPRSTSRATVRLTDAEWLVMEPVWSAPGVSAREVCDLVHDATGWSYSTVKTQLTRLVEKGVLREGWQGNTANYTARLSRDEARRGALRSMLDAAFGGRLGSLVQHLVADEKLSGREREELRRLVEDDLGRP